MTPAISTRLAAVSPSPEIASSAGSRSAPPDNSPVTTPLGPAPTNGLPSLLDSLPSDPMTPDPTPFAARHFDATAPEHASSMTSHHDATRIPPSKDNTPACHA